MHTGSYLCGQTAFKIKGDLAPRPSSRAIDAPADVKFNRHIFTADQGDYYDISDDLPKRAQ